MEQPESYLWNNTLAEEKARLDAQASIWDPYTQRYLDALGIAPGWQCLEIGAGSGTMTAWLAQRVSPTGSVVAVDVDRRVLLLEAAERREDLVLVALVLRLDRERHHRRRQLRQRDVDGLVLRGEHVARVRLLQLGDRADVTRAELVGVLHLLALRDRSWPIRSLTCARVLTSCVSAFTTPW